MYKRNVSDFMASIKCNFRAKTYDELFFWQCMHQNNAMEINQRIVFEMFMSFEPLCVDEMLELKQKHEKTHVFRYTFDK